MQPPDRGERGRHQHPIDVVGIAPAAQAIVAVAPVACHFTRLQGDELPPVRLPRERRRGSDDVAQIAHEPRTPRLVVRTDRQIEEARRAASSGGRVQQIMRRDQREQKVVVDHLVIEQRLAGGRQAHAQAAQHREFTDVFLVSHLAGRIQPRKHGRQAGLGGPRLQHRGEQPQRHQRVAPEVGVEAPRSREEFLLIRQKGQCAAQALVRCRVPRQQLVLVHRRQRTLAAQRGDAQPHATVHRRRQLERSGLRRIAGYRPVQHLDRQVVPGRVVEARARPDEAAFEAPGRREDLDRHAARVFVFTDHTHAAQDRLLDRDRTSRGRDLGDDATPLTPCTVVAVVRTRRALRRRDPDVRLPHQRLCARAQP